MSVVTVGEMIDRAKTFEEKLERYYADLRDRATKDGVRLVTYYLARRKQHLPQTLRDYPAGQLERIRQTPFKYDEADLDLEKCFDGKDLPSDTDAERLFEVAIEFVDQLIAFYRHLSEQQLGKDVQGLFGSLLKIEEKDIVELKKMRAMHYF